MSVIWIDDRKTGGPVDIIKRRGAFRELLRALPYLFGFAAGMASTYVRVHDWPTGILWAAIIVAGPALASTARCIEESL